jgi:hypothetical protein
MRDSFPPVLHATEVPEPVTSSQNRPEIEIPDWVENTPDDTVYELIMWNPEGDSAQQLEMSREEYIALKAHLAAMRGYKIGDFRARIPGLPREMRDNEIGRRFFPYYDSIPIPPEEDDDTKQQSARSIQTARELYQVIPELVVFQSAEFDEYLESLAE